MIRCALATLLALFVFAAPASAQRLADFELRPSASLQPRVDALAGKLQKRDVGALLAGIGPEDLSFWPGRNEVWTVTEHAGKRMLYGVPG